MLHKTRSVTLLIFTVVGGLVAGAATGFEPADPRTLVVAAALLWVGTLASPGGGSGLGAGALFVALLLDRGGLFAASVAAGAGAALGSPLLRWPESLRPPTRRALAIATNGGIAGLSTLSAGGWMLLFVGSGSADTPAIGPLLGAALAFGSCAGLARRWLTPGSEPLSRIIAVGALDTLAIACGAPVLTLARASASLWLPLAAVYCALCLAAGRERRRALLNVLGRERLERLRWASQRLSAASGDLAAVAEQLYRECRRATGCAYFQLELDDDAGGGRLWHAGPEGQVLPGEACPPPSPPPLPGVHRRVGWRVLERWLSGTDGQLGRLRLWSDPRRLRPEHEALLDELLPQLQASLAHALLDRQAKEDPLTGAALRRVLEARLESSFRTARESGRPLSVALLDLDHFKHLNDTYGHAAGDRALTAVVEAIHTELRSEDLLARYGGEEFALVLEGLSGDAALQVAERLRQRIAAIALPADDGSISLTSSSGVVSFPEVHVKQAAHLLELADEALYAAKEAGRDRCLLYLGPQRYRDPSGTDHGGGNRRVSAPRLF